jgi:hypothetical protein
MPLCMQVTKAPSALKPGLTILADSLFTLYKKGHVVRDTLFDEVFICRAVLLYWSGDYPGQGLAAGFAHCGRRFCHWCETLEYHDKAITRQVVGRFRRHLPPDDEKRTNPMYGAPEEDDQPQTRTHEKVCADGHASDAWDGAKSYHPRKMSGINWFCPLGYLPLFDLVWDFTPDIMHVIETGLKEHLIPLMKGDRNPKAPKQRGAGTKEQQTRYYNTTYIPPVQTFSTKCGLKVNTK